MRIKREEILLLLMCKDHRDGTAKLLLYTHDPDREQVGAYKILRGRLTAHDRIRGNLLCPLDGESTNVNLPLSVCYLCVGFPS